MAGKRVDIRYQHRSTLCHGSSTNPAANGDTDASGLALKWADDQLAVAHEIETNPVDGRQHQEKLG
jgi:hypothetical protein